MMDPSTPVMNDPAISNGKEVEACVAGILDVDAKGAAGASNEIFVTAS